MTEIEQPVIDAASYLAALPAGPRDRAWKQIRSITLASIPDEELTKPPVCTLGEYLDRPVETPPALVEPGLVVRGGVTAMIARAGKGKTSIALNRFVRWSMGRPLFDDLPDVNTPVQPLRILIIENEGAPGHFQKILRTIVTANGFTAAEIELARTNLHIWGDGGWSGLKLDNDENVKMVSRAVEQTGADICFLEPFRGLWRGNENDSTEMANLLDAFSSIAAEHECAFMVTHHERKSGAGEDGDPMSAARGSTVLEGFCGVMERWRHVAGGHQSELSWIKARYENPPSPVRVEFDRETWSYRYVKQAESERRVVGFLAQFPDSWCSLAEIAEELEEPQANVRRWAAKALDTDKPLLAKRMAEGKAHYRYRGPTDPDEESGGLAIS